MTIEIIKKITENWTKEETEKLKATNSSFKNLLKNKEKTWEEVKRLEGQKFNPYFFFSDYCVIDNKYTTEIHDFHHEDSKDFWGNIWTVRTCQRNGCGRKSEGYSSYVPGSIPNEVNIKLNAWDMLKVKELLDSIANNEKEVNSIKQILNNNKDCEKGF